MIDNFPNTRRKSCETSTFLNILEYYGYQVSEPKTFGIGSGIYFLYSPFLQIRGVALPIMPRIKSIHSLDELVGKKTPGEVVVSVLDDCSALMDKDADIMENIGQQEKEIFTRIDSEFLKSSSALKYA